MNVDKPLLVDTGKGFTIKYQGKFLYSSLDPLHAVKKQLAALTLTDNTVYFVPAVGLGYGLAGLLARLPSSSFILCVEKDTQLMQLALAQQQEPLPRHPRLAILRTDEPAQACRLLHRQGIWHFRRLKTVPLCAGHRLYPDFYSELEKALAAEIQTYWQNKMTLIHMGKLWIKNLFSNLPLLARAHNLAELATTAPIVVAGAGPSLEMSLGWLRQARSRFLLLAVDTALPVLGDHGLKPDLIFMLESQFVNIYDFMAHPFFDVPVLCDLTAAPPVLRLFRDKVFFFASRFFPLQLLERLEKAGLVRDWLPPLGSVGVAAVQAAVQITSGPVILTGLDFSYPGKKIHARGAPSYRLMLDRQRRVLPLAQLHFSALARRPLLALQDKNGQPVMTDLVLAAYAENLAAIATANRERIFDYGEQGLPTGAGRLFSTGELMGLLAGCPLPPGSLTVTGAGLTPQEKKAAVDGFIGQEQGRLQAGLSLIRERLAGQAAGADAAAFESVESVEKESGRVLSPAENELLEQLDYLYFYFPDKEPLQGLSPGFLARLQQAAAYFSAIVC